MAVARGLKVTVIDLTSAAEIRERAATPYGVFGLYLNGRPLSHGYLTEKALAKRLDAMPG